MDIVSLAKALIRQPFSRLTSLPPAADACYQRSINT